VNTTRPEIKVIAAVGLLLAVVVVLTWGNYQFALNNPGGSDFMPRWLGTRDFLTLGRSPYSQGTTRAIQRFFYGRTALAGEDQQLFVYPFYSMLVFAPFAWTDNYELARAIWMTTLELSLGGIAFISLVLVEWQPKRKVLIIYLLFAFMWYHAVRPVINGNASVMVALFIVFTLFGVVRGNFVSAGIMLALSTIKPHMVVLFVPFVLWWALSRRELRLIWSFLVSMLLLVGGSLLLDRYWIIDNLRQIIAYPQYTLPGTPGAIFAGWWPDNGGRIGIWLTAVLALLLLREWLAAYGKDTRWFLWTAGITLVITNLIGIRTATANYIALFPLLPLLFSLWEQRWQRVGRWLVLITMALLFIGIWWLFLATLIKAEQPTQHPLLFFPLPIFLFIAFYWMRYWSLVSRQYRIRETKKGLELAK